MNNNIACYIRVSSDKQDQLQSLKQQRELLQRTYMDNEILMYSDVGTGTSFKREGFKKLLYDAGLNEKKLKDVIEKIKLLVKDDKIPPIEKSKKCKKCAYYPYCYI